jgi:hypothetical protein
MQAKTCCSSALAADAEAIKASKQAPIRAEPRLAKNMNNSHQTNQLTRLPQGCSNLGMAYKRFFAKPAGGFLISWILAWVSRFAADGLPVKVSSNEPRATSSSMP